MARVIRDENGKVVDLIEYDEEDHVDTTPWGKQLNADEEEPVDQDQALLPPRLNEGRDTATVQGMFSTTNFSTGKNGLGTRAGRTLCVGGRTCLAC